MCDPECPNLAIFYGEEVYQIDPDKCTECVGHYDEPQCIKACPIDCIITDPDIIESHDELMAKFISLHKPEVCS